MNNDRKIFSGTTPSMNPTPTTGTGSPAPRILLRSPGRALKISEAIESLNQKAAGSDRWLPKDARRSIVDSIFTHGRTVRQTVALCRTMHPLTPEISEGDVIEVIRMYHESELDRVQRLAYRRGNLTPPTGGPAALLPMRRRLAS